MQVTFCSPSSLVQREADQGYLPSRFLGKGPEIPKVLIIDSVVFVIVALESVIRMRHKIIHSLGQVIGAEQQQGGIQSQPSL